jgi:hypothetical protein
VAEIGYGMLLTRKTKGLADGQTMSLRARYRATSQTTASTIHLVNPRGIRRPLSLPGLVQRRIARATCPLQAAATAHTTTHREYMSLLHRHVIDSRVSYTRSTREEMVRVVVNDIL